MSMDPFSSAWYRPLFFLFFFLFMGQFFYYGFFFPKKKIEKEPAPPLTSLDFSNEEKKNKKGKKKKIMDFNELKEEKKNFYAKKKKWEKEEENFLTFHSQLLGGVHQIRSMLFDFHMECVGLRKEMVRLGEHFLRMGWLLSGSISLFFLLKSFQIARSL